MRSSDNKVPGLFHYVQQLYPIIRYVTSSVTILQCRQSVRTEREQDSDNICGDLVIDQITWSSYVGGEPREGEESPKKQTQPPPMAIFGIIF